MYVACGCLYMYSGILVHKMADVNEIHVANNGFATGNRRFLKTTGTV